MTTAVVDFRNLETGVHAGLRDEEYDQIDAVRSSMLLKFRKTPLHAKHDLDHPSGPSQPMIIGQALHALLLRPDEFTRYFAKAPTQEKRSAKDKAAWAALEAEHPEAHVLRPSDWDRVFVMRDRVLAHEGAKRMLSRPGKRELTLVWEDPETGLRCKARLDHLGRQVSAWDDQEWPAITDIKTTRDASDFEFRKSIWTYGYDVQAAHYLSGAETIAPVERKWFFLLVESEEPHAVRICEMEPAALDLGRKRRDRFLALYAECTRTGHWPGYGNGPDFIGPPTWAYREEGAESE